MQYMLSSYFKLVRNIYYLQIYKEMAADFRNKLQAQNPGVPAQIKVNNKIIYVKGFSNVQINNQLKSAAKALHKTEKAKKAQGFVSKAIGPVINGLYTGRKESPCI